MKGVITLVVLGLLLVGSRGEGECPIAFAECETETQYLACGSTTTDTASVYFSDVIEYESEIFIQSVCDDLEWAEIVYSLNSNQIFVPGATSVSGLLVDEETSFSSFGIVGDVNQALIIRVIGLSADEPLKLNIEFSVTVIDNTPDEVIVSSNIMFPDSSIINFPPPPPVRIGDEDPNTACFDQAPLGKVCMTVEEDSENICLITASLTQNDEQTEVVDLPIVMAGEDEVCQSVVGGWCQLCSSSQLEVWPPQSCPIIKMMCLGVLETPLRVGLECRLNTEVLDCSEDCRKCDKDHGFCEEGICKCNDGYLTSDADESKCSTFCGEEHNEEDKAVVPGEVVSISIEEGESWTGVVSLSDVFGQLQENQKFVGFEVSIAPSSNSQEGGEEEDNLLEWTYGCRPANLEVPDSQHAYFSESTRVFLSEESEECPTDKDTLANGLYENLYLSLLCFNGQCDYDLVVTSFVSNYLNKSLLLPISATPQFMHLDIAMSLEDIIETEIQISFSAYLSEDGDLLPLDTIPRPSLPPPSPPTPPTSSISSANGIEFLNKFSMAIGSCGDFVGEEEDWEEEESGVVVEVTTVFGADSEDDDEVAGGVVQGTKEWSVEDYLNPNSGEWFFVMEGVEGLENYYVKIELVGEEIVSEDDQDHNDEEKTVCEINCVHGACDELDNCICDDKWEGEYCINYVHEEIDGELNDNSLPKNLPLYVIGAVICVAVFAVVVRSVARSIGEWGSGRVERVGGDLGMELIVNDGMEDDDL